MELGAHTCVLDAVPIATQHAYAQRIQARRPAKVRELKESTRTIELVFFLRITLLELTDALPGLSAASKSPISRSFRRGAVRAPARSCRYRLRAATDGPIRRG